MILEPLRINELGVVVHLTVSGYVSEGCGVLIHPLYCYVTNTIFCKYDKWMTTLGNSPLFEDMECNFMERSTFLKWQNNVIAILYIVEECSQT